MTRAERVDWQRVTMPGASVEVPGRSFVHAIDEPPDDLTAMRVVRSGADAPVPFSVILSARPWQDGWHLSHVVQRFAGTCIEGTVTSVPIDVSGARVARRLDGKVEREEGYGREDDVEATVLVLARERDHHLVSLTIRLDPSDLDLAGPMLERIVGSFTVSRVES